tara:strand:+ start:91 stop:420 length:330 start_codon:yes stop_codon:yes gene_type:complete
MAEPEFIDRINNPEKYPYIQNSDGSVSSHRMAAETDEEGNWFVFPTIQLIGGKLKEFDNNQAAMQSALKTNNFLKMKNKAEALRYASGGYKTKKFKQFRPNPSNRADYE